MGPTTSSAAEYAPLPVNVRIKLAALWTSTLFVFAYVDLFSLYRADFRADIESGEISGFTINQTFLLGTTMYILIPSLMVFLSLVLAPRVARITNIVLPAFYALTIVGAAIGEWNYFVLGSAVEIVLLGAIATSSWRWPTLTGSSTVSATEVRAPATSR